MGEWLGECIWLWIWACWADADACVMPDTLGIWGGGSEDAEVVSDVRGWRDAGVEARRSE
jgi:hypothetical protein